MWPVDKIALKIYKTGSFLLRKHLILKSEKSPLAMTLYWMHARVLWIIVLKQVLFILNEAKSQRYRLVNHDRLNVSSPVYKMLILYIYSCNLSKEICILVAHQDYHKILVKNENNVKEKTNLQLKSWPSLLISCLFQSLWKADSRCV